MSCINNLLSLRSLNSNKGEQPNIAFNACLAFRIGSRHACSPKEFVHFLQCTAHSLGDKEINVRNADGGDTAEEDEGTEIACFHEGACARSDREIVELGCIRKCDYLEAVELIRLPNCYCRQATRPWHAYSAGTPR